MGVWVCGGGCRSSYGSTLLFSAIQTPCTINQLLRAQAAKALTLAPKSTKVSKVPIGVIFPKEAKSRMKFLQSVNICR